MIHGALEKPEGYQEHHRQKRRSGDDRPVNILYVSPALHEWIEKHPEEAAKLGWTVSQNENPEDVSVVLPDVVPGAKKPRAKGDERKEKLKKRRVLQVRVPDTAEENGAEIYDDYLERCRAELKRQYDLKWHEKKESQEDFEKRAYYIHLAVMEFFLQEHKP